MLNIGLTSVTFRNLDAFEIIDYCVLCGIDRIEWGSDVHVPVGDTLNAEKVKEACKRAGISVSSYGSYYRCGNYQDSESTFKSYIEIAKILKAPTIRIWVGSKNYEDADSEYIEKTVKELQMMCDLAKAENIEIGCEFHGGTLCNSGKSSLAIIEKVNRDNFGMYFQYDTFISMEENIANLNSFLPYIKNVHVFNIDPDKRYSLAEKGGEQMWSDFTDILYKNNINTNLLFEFLPDPTKEGLLKETQILKKIISR